MTFFRLLLLPCILSSVFFFTEAFAFSDCEQDCQKCHTITKKDVEALLKDANSADAKVLDIKMSTVKGLWEVSLDKQGKKGNIYIDFSKKYLIGGPIVKVASGKDTKTSERLTEISRKAKLDTTQIPLKEALVMGEARAPKKVIVFTDPDCPFCGKFHSEIKKITEKNRDIVFYIKLFPLQFHKDAYWKSKTMVCLKSLKLLEDNFAGKPVPKPNCSTSEVDNNLMLARKFGITGTPTSIMPNGLAVTGYLQAEELVKKINAELR